MRRFVHALMGLGLGVVPSVGCGSKAPDGAEVAPAVTDVAAAPDPMRDKLLALAVASECMRKAQTPPEQTANTMLALYKAHAVDLETYTREMSRLAGDSAFQAEIDARTRDCPTNPDAPDARVAVADTAPSPALDTSVAAAPDTGPEASADSAATDSAATDSAATDSAATDTAPPPDSAATDSAATDTAATDTAPPPADTAPPPDDTQVALADTSAPEALLPEALVPEVALDTTPSPDTAIADTRLSETSLPALDVADAGPVTPPTPEPEVDFSGNWTGQIGGTPGTLRMTVRGRTITSATATFGGRTTIKLKGTLSDKGLLSLGGTSGDDFMRMSGKAQTSGRVINGTWDGVVDKRKSSGRFLVKR